MRRVWMGLSVLLAACGTDARLTNLRCDNPCQTTEDPFTARLLVDFEDPSGVLPESTLLSTVDAGRSTVLEPIWPGGAAGTLAFTVPLNVVTLTEGDTYDVQVEAQTDAGPTNSVGLTLTVHL